MGFAENDIRKGLVIETIEEVFSGSDNIKVLDTGFKEKGDIDIEVTLKIQRGTKKLLIIIGTSGEPRILKSKILDLMGFQMEGYPVYMAPYISHNNMDLFKEKGVGFIDLSGNAYLSFANVLISRKGNENSFKEKRTIKRLFSKKATRIFRKLLEHPDRKWKTMELSREADVSSGFVSMVLKNLSKEGYVEKDWGSIKLIKPGQLLDRWSEEYRFEKQRSIGYFCPYKQTEQVFEKLGDLDDSIYALTMGSAASLIAPHVRSTDIYIYSRDDSILIERLDLTPVEFGGNLYLTTPADIGVFFDKQYREGLSIVSNIQLYLDLYNYPARGREQAEFLRENVMEI